VVDLSGIEELRGVRTANGGDGIEIGAMTTLTERGESSPHQAEV
jgi:CO/xanthine dehydrogenase FAD-binding subunit